MQNWSGIPTVPLHADLCSWPVNLSGAGDWKFQLCPPASEFPVAFSQLLYVPSFRCRAWGRRFWLAEPPSQASTHSCREAGNTSMHFFYPLKRGWALLLTRPYKLVDSVVMKMIFKNWAAKNNDTYILWLVYLYFWASWSTAKQFFIQTFYFIWRKILVVQQWAAVGTSKQNPWSGRNLCYLV